jgi:branched-chain amino acid transport system substrate-binding protein
MFGHRQGKGGRRSRSAVAGVAAAAVMILAASACSSGGGSSSAGGSTSGTIQIGAILPISGSLSYYGTEYRRGMELAATDINAAGGIDGQKVQFTYLDDGGDTTTALNAVRSLHSKGVSIVTGSGSSTTDLAISQLADSLGMTSWMLGTSTSLVTRGLKNMVAPSVLTENFVGAAFAIFKQVPTILNTPMNKLTVALVYSNDAYGTSNATAEAPVLTGLGAKVVAKVPYDITSTDYSSVIAKLKSANPMVVVQTGYTDDVVLMWKQAKAAGYQPKFMIGSGGTGTLNFVQALGSYADGFASYGYALPTTKIAASETFGTDYQKAYGAPLTSGHALMVYSAMLMLRDVLKKAGATDPAKITAAAHSLSEPVGTYPNGCGFKLTSGGENTLCSAGGYQWQSQKLVPVWPASIATATLVGPLPIAA